MFSFNTFDFFIAILYIFVGISSLINANLFRERTQKSDLIKGERVIEHKVLDLVFFLKKTRII